MSNLMTPSSQMVVRCLRILASEDHLGRLDGLVRPGLSLYAHLIVTNVLVAWFPHTSGTQFTASVMHRGVSSRKHIVFRSCLPSGVIPVRRSTSVDCTLGASIVGGF